MSLARWAAFCNGSQPRNADADFYHGEHRAHRGAFASSFFLHPSYFFLMTLGRTSSGAIKIKTDGGLRAVNCACCGGECACGSATPINPPSDPDFTKKLRGDDPSVTPFTQVSVTYNILASVGSYSTGGSGSMSGNWSDGTNCFGAPIKAFYGTGCDYGVCGFCSKEHTNSDGLVNTSADLQLKLESTGCLRVILIDNASVAGVGLSGQGFTPSDFGSGTDCSIPDESGNLSITINGVGYPVVEFDSLEGFSVTASLDITFS